MSIGLLHHDVVLSRKNEDSFLTFIINNSYSLFMLLESFMVAFFKNIFLNKNSCLLYGLSLYGKFHLVLGDCNRTHFV